MCDFSDRGGRLMISRFSFPVRHWSRASATTSMCQLCRYSVWGFSTEKLRTVEESRRKTNDGLDHVVIDQEFADKLFLATSEKHAMRHDGGHVAVRLEAGQHVLNEHEVGLFPRFGTPFTEAGCKLQRRATVILGKGRVSKDTVEFADLSVIQN